MFGTIWASVVFQFLVHFKTSNVCALEIDELTQNWWHALKIFSWGVWIPQRNSEMKILILLYNQNKAKSLAIKLKNTKTCLWWPKSMLCQLFGYMLANIATNVFYDYFTAKL